MYEEEKTSSDKIVDVNEHDDDKTSIVVAGSRRNKNKLITIIGGSLFKDIKTFKIRSTLSSSDKVYTKSFPKLALQRKTGEIM